MTKTMEQLYYDTLERVSAECSYREKFKAIAQVEIMLSKELEELCDSKDVTVLLDMRLLMGDQRQELHERALFEAALTLGMELGRLS